MTIIRIKKEKNYTNISNTPLRDKRMSLKAMGLLTYMISCSDDWNFTVRGLETVLKDGRESIRSGLKELENLGYLQRVKNRNPDGSFGNIEYIVSDEPSLLQSEEYSPQSENPHMDCPNTDTPTTEELEERSTIANTNIHRSNYYKKNNQSIQDMSDSVKTQIAYETLCEDEDKKLIDNIVDIMVELLYLSESGQQVKLGEDKYSAEWVQDRIKRLDMFHVQYVITCFKIHSSKVHNVKSYLAKSLVNAPATMEAYYDAQARSDMKYWSNKG